MSKHNDIIEYAATLIGNPGAIGFADSERQETASDIIDFFLSSETAIGDIYRERIRQIEAEGWTEAHDDEHSDGSLAEAAACYTSINIPCETRYTEGYDGGMHPHEAPILWPKSWSIGWLKRSDRRRDLVKAASLIVAEIERIDRAFAQEPK